MTRDQLLHTMEARQVAIYFAAVLLGAVAALTIPGTTSLEAAINPALGLMLFVTFLQVPLAALGQALKEIRFLTTLLVVNFIVVPLLVAGLIQFVPADPVVQLGVLLVLLTPCIDYVVTFSHLGGADARLLLGATPALLIVQILLLPVYLGMFLGDEAARLVEVGPFIHAFVWLIAIPLALAIACQFWAARSPIGERVSSALGLLPVPATTLVLFVVVVAVLPQLGPASETSLRILPVFAAFAIVAPIAGWLVSRLVTLNEAAGRAVAFSAGTRNSLVVLPIALAVPNAVPLLPAIIVTQTMVELLASLVYIRCIPRLRR